MTDVIWVTALRLLNTLAVLVVPLPAFWLSGHIDRRDWSWLGMPTATEHQQDLYQYWDKSLDTLLLALACIVALSWKDPLVRRLAIAAFAWRVIGVAAFFSTGKTEVFLAFPSVFGELFPFYLLYRLLARRDRMLSGWADAVIVMLALTLPKVAEEYFIHVGSRPWQTVTLLPASLSTPDREYWAWVPIMMVLPVLAMLWTLFRSRSAPNEQRIPLMTALLGRQVGETEVGEAAPTRGVLWPRASLPSPGWRKAAG